MHSGLGRLVNFNNKNGLELIGMLFSQLDISGVSSNTLIIHIHGNYGNFYNNKFLWVMSKAYVASGVDFLSFNLSAHDGLCEGYDNGALRYVGGAVAKFDESILDIEAAVQYANNIGYTRIILQGHSLGCDKAIQYLLLYPYLSYELILLSPVDSHAVQKKWIKAHKHTTVEDQISALKCLPKTEGGFHWLSIDEYGAEGTEDDWVYKIPVTRDCLISILESAAFKYLNLESGEAFTIRNRTLALLGTNDGLQMSSQSEFSSFLHMHFTELEIIDDLQCDHDIKGVETELTKRVIGWINAIEL